MTLRTFLGTIAATAAALTVFTYIVALALSLTLLFSTSIGQDLLRSEANLVIGAYFYETRVPLQINALAGYLGTFLIYVACFWLAIRNNGGLVAGLRKLTGRTTSQRTPNWFSIMPLVSSALLLLVVVITAIQNSVGLPTGSLPRIDPYKMLYGLAYAPIVEEIAFRISVIGTLVAARTLWHTYLSDAIGSELPPGRFIVRTVRLAILGFLFPERAKAEAGLPRVGTDGLRGIHWSEWAALVLTSMAFGLAHLLANSGWEVGKVLSAALQGFAIGAAYLAYGAFASILFHWYFNVYFYVISLAPTIVEETTSILILATGVLGFGLLLRLAISARQNAAGPGSANGLYLGGPSSRPAEA